MIEIQSLIAWLLVALVVPAAYPLARELLTLSPAADGRALTWALALALAVGVLTLVMFWMGVLGIAFSVEAIALVYAAVMLGGAWVTHRTLGRDTLRPDTASSDSSSLDPHSSFLIPSVLLALIAVAIFFNAAYWPFTRDDAVGIYHPFAQMMAHDRMLVPLIGAESLHRAYPMAIPLTYTFAYLASGWDNEYLARVLPALLALGCLPASYLLARRLGGERAGWIGALLLAVTPTFGAWASSGYTDLPMGFYYALAALFALRLWQTGGLLDAALAGACMGLAAWTKNNALIGIPVLALWLGWAWVNRRASLRVVIVSLIVCGAIAAPWYARNLIEAGFLLPDTAWVDQARHTLDNLLAFVTLPQDYGIPGWVMLAGLGWGIWRALRRPRAAAGEAALLVWFAPFFAAWWLLASYDPRFLLSALPLACALGGAWLAAVWTRVPTSARRPLAWATLTLAVVLTLYTIFYSVEYKDALLRNPLMGDVEKKAVVAVEREG